MKKSLSALTALLLAATLLAATLLAGCGAPGDDLPAPGQLVQQLMGTETGAIRDDMPAFSDIEYRRPDPDRLEALEAQTVQALDQGLRLGKVTALLDEFLDEYYHIQTMYVLADIRACQDTGDSFYAGEYTACSDICAQADQVLDRLYAACAGSPMAERLERDYFWEGFVQEYGPGGSDRLSDESVELMRRESELIAGYRSAVANAQIVVDGQAVSARDYLDSAWGEDYDRALRQYYETNNPVLSEIYIELVKVRGAMAQAMGYDSFQQLQFEDTFDRDYSPEEAELFLEEVKACFVPVYKELMSRSPYLELDYCRLGEKELMGVLSSAAESMGGDIWEAFRFMVDHGLYDAQRRSSKAALSFQTYLTDQEAPFLFLYPEEDLRDVLGFAHELGHYTDAYVNYNAYKSLDLAECYSQAMEYLILSRVGDRLGAYEREQLKTAKLLDSMELYVQQASFAEFEALVYEMSDGELTAEALNSLSLELAREYGSYEPGWSGEEIYYSMGWTDISHFFEQPFYVISYPVSDCVALQIYELELAGPGAGLEKLKELLTGDSQQLLAAVEAAGLESPLARGRVQESATALRRWLEA